MNNKKQAQKRLQSDDWYSVRRYFVDVFFIKHIEKLSSGKKILDIGGIKNKKRGEFNIDEYGHSVTYVNIDEADEPDILADAAEIPVDDNSFDVIILAEVLEHVPHAREVLAEAYRILKVGGTLLITTPFMYHEHADPHDYLRYTSFWYKSQLQKLGFNDIAVERHGGFFSVLSGMLKFWNYNMPDASSSLSRLRQKLLRYIAYKFVSKSQSLDSEEYYKNHEIFSAHTTGFGIVASK